MLLNISKSLTLSLVVLYSFLWEKNYIIIGIISSKIVSENFDIGIEVHVVWIATFF